jgi:prepilin-type N-terminal cleavage/methylation domain-containing protein
MIPCFAKLKESHAFTLVEILVALVIITTAIMGAMVIFRNGFLSIEKVRLNNRFANAAMVVMETIKCTDLSSKSKGRGAFGSIKYIWNAKKIKSGSVRAFKGSAKASSAYELILYKVSISTSFKNVSREFIYYQLGWKKNI